MKSVLLYVHDDLGAESRLQAACDLARATNGHIRAVQVTAIPDIVAADTYGGAYLTPELLAELTDREDKIRASVEERLRREGVSWDWRRLEGDVIRGLLSVARLADVIVVTMPEGPRTKFTDPPDIAADLAVSGRVPVIAVPQNARSLLVAGKAVIAWDGSQEASSALRLAIPLLKLAQEVHVLTVEEKGKYAFPATEASEYLARHGIGSQLHAWPRVDGNVADTLMGAIRELSPDWIVMGAFGHSRMREFIFGGVTRTMLREASVPILLAH